MERHEDAVFALSKLNLDNIEKNIHEAYHQKGPGRPPRNPLGIFKALLTKRLRQIPRTESSTGDCGTTLC